RPNGSWGSVTPGLAVARQSDEGSATSLPLSCVYRHTVMTGGVVPLGRHECGHNKARTWTTRSGQHFKPPASADNRPGVASGEQRGHVTLAVLLDGGVELVGHQRVVDRSGDIAEDADGGLVQGVGVGEARQCECSRGARAVRIVDQDL